MERKGWIVACTHLSPASLVGATSDVLLLLFVSTATLHAHARPSPSEATPMMVSCPGNPTGDGPTQFPWIAGRFTSGPLTKLPIREAEDMVHPSVPLELHTRPLSASTTAGDSR